MMTRKLGPIIFLILLATSFTGHQANAQAFVNRPKGLLSGPETKAERDLRMRWGAHRQRCGDEVHRHNLETS